MGSSGSFEWSVSLPGSKGSRSTFYKPKASICVDSESCGHEELFVPVSVAKVLARHRKDGESLPDSRAELIFQLSWLEETECRKRVEGLINRRDYSTSELTLRLQRDGYPSDVVKSVVERMVEVGVLNDSRYADVFIRSKISSGWGELRIERELSRRGVDVETLDGWPDSYFDATNEAERAYELASRRRFSGRDPYVKAVRYLIGRGFSYSVASDVASRLKDEGTLLG